LTLWNRFSSLPEGIDATPRGGSGFHPTPKSGMTIFKEDGFGLLHQVKERYIESGPKPFVDCFSFKADGKGRSSLETTKGLVVFFSTNFVARFVKELRLPSKAGAKIVHLFLPPRLVSFFFGLFFEQEF
jgi:hypothetical protein